MFNQSDQSGEVAGTRCGHNLIEGRVVTENQMALRLLVPEVIKLKHGCNERNNYIRNPVIAEND